MSTRISACGYCRKTEFTAWYSKSAPRDSHGRLDRDYLDSEPVAYCSEEHRDAADALRAEVVAEFEAYPGELAMLRGVLGVVRTIARVGDLGDTEGGRELRRIVAEHYADERAACAEQGEKDTRQDGGESTPQPAGACGRALSTGQPCPDHPRQPAELPYTEARAAFMQIGHTPSLQGLRTELHIEGRPPLVGRYCGAGMRRSEAHDGVLFIEPMLAFEYAEPAEGGDAR